MSKVVVCGLGPGDQRYLTQETVKTIETSDRVFLRTSDHPCAELCGDYTSFDSLYESSDSFEEVYEQIVATLASQASVGDVVYVTPGSPLVQETVVELLIENSDVEVEIVPAMSFLDLVWSRLRVDPINQNVLLCDSQNFHSGLAHDGPILVSQIYSKDFLSEVKLSVEHPHPDDVAVVLKNLGTAEESIIESRLTDLDRHEVNNFTCLYIPQLNGTSVQDVQHIVELIHTLRSECPWDREQTHESLVKHLKEETLEVAEAIEQLASTQDFEHLEQELGDLLLQVLLHSELATESGQFTFYDVVRTLSEKMIRRHPHVFGESNAETMDELAKQWEDIKAQERNA